MQGIFRKENTDKALKYGIYRHLPTYEKIIRNLVSFSDTIKAYNHAGEKYSGRYNMKMEIKESGKMKYFEKNH